MFIVSGKTKKTKKKWSLNHLIPKCSCKQSKTELVFHTLAFNINDEAQHFPVMDHNHQI